MDVSIYGVGVSLVNNDMDVRRELAYLGVTSSSIVWEVRREGKQRYKSLTTAQCQVGTSASWEDNVRGYCLRQTFMLKTDCQESFIVILWGQGSWSFEGYGVRVLAPAPLSIELPKRSFIRMSKLLYF